MTGYCRECNMSSGPAALTFIHLCDSFASGTREPQTMGPWFSTDGGKPTTGYAD
jgi:hypothetical protein